MMNRVGFDLPPFSGAVEDVQKVDLTESMGAALHLFLKRIFLLFFPLLALTVTLRPIPLSWVKSRVYDESARPSAIPDNLLPVDLPELIFSLHIPRALHAVIRE